MKITGIQKLILVILFSVVATFMSTSVSFAEMERPETKPFESYRTVTTGELKLIQSQTVYLKYNMPYNGYFKIKRLDNTLVLEVNRLSKPLPAPSGLYLEAGTYTIETYGGNGMANGYNVNDSGIKLEITYINKPTGKMVRIIEGTGAFTTNITTTIYYDWSGGVGTSSLPGFTCNGINPAFLHFSGPDSKSEGPYENPNGKFIGKPGNYTVTCSGGSVTPPMTSTIYYKGSVDIWYDDTKPKFEIDSSKKGQWVKGSSDGSIKVDYQIKFPEGTPNSPGPLLVKVFFGPKGQNASLYKSHSYNPATPTNIAGNWPVPADANGRYRAYAELWEDNGANLKLKISNEIDFNIDNTAPTLNVTKSPEQAFYSSTTTPIINFDYTASDTDTGSGFNKVVVHINGIAQPALLLPSGTYQWSIPNSGQHTISFTAFDLAGDGNQSTSQAFPINIDNTNPEFSGNLQVDPAPVYLSYVNSETVTYYWTAVNEANLKEYLIKIESVSLNNPTGWTTVLDWTSTGTTASYPYAIPAECNGQMLKATVKAVDLAGNEAGISLNIISDQSVSAVILPEYATRFQTGSTPGAGKVVCKWNPLIDTINGIPGSGSGIAYYELALTESGTAPDQNQPLQTATGSSHEFSNVSSNGTYYLWVRGVDRAGNRGVWTMSGPFPDFQARGPGNNTTVETAVFQATARTLSPNKELKFQLKYQRTDASAYETLPGGYQTAALTPSLNYGNWNWYLEMMEYDSLGNPIPESLQTTEIFMFHLENDTLVPVILQPILTTPGAIVQFSAIVTEPERIVSYQWETGDNHTLNGQTPQHSYRNVLDFDPASRSLSKVYPLKLTVTFTDGTHFTAESTVTVQNTGKGTLYTPETWKGIHNIYGDITVPAGVILTIEPGTQIIIHQSPGQTGYSNALRIEGILKAGVDSTNSDLIAFTPDNNAALEGWQGITITGTAELYNVSIHKAKRAITTIDTSNVTVKNCSISNNYTGVHVCGGHPVISGTTFTGNTLYAIKEENGWPRVSGCLFTGNGIDYYHDTLTKITVQQLNSLPDRGNEGNTDQD